MSVCVPFPEQHPLKPVSSMLFDLECLEEQPGDPEQERFGSIQAKVSQMVQAAAESVSQVSDVLAQLTQQDDLIAAAQALGYSVRLRDCVGGGQGSSCLQNLRHSFLILSPSSHCAAAATTSNSKTQQQQLRVGPGAAAEEIIIDPTFRDSFVIAHPSARYTAVLEALPPVFFGTLSKVQPLVELLCSEMSLAFKEAGNVMPPWRSLRSMMTKWMPRRSLDLPLPASGSCGSGGAAATTAHAAPPSTAAHGAGAGGSSSGRLLRQACRAADTAAHSSLGPSSTASAIHSASSSNCSSSSAGLPHAALRHAAESAGCESGGSSPGPAVTNSNAAARAAAVRGPRPRDVQQVLTNHAGDTSADAETAAGSPVTAPRVVKCFEPLQRVVGGFGFGTTPV